MNYLTVPQIAKMHGVTQGRIWQIAKERGVRPVARLSRIALWTAAQAKQLKPGTRAKAARGAASPKRGKRGTGGGRGTSRVRARGR